MGKKLPNGYWTKEKCHEEALKFKYKIDFRNKSNSAYVIAYSNKWLDEICSQMIPNRKPKGFWTKENCANEALKHKKIGDLKRNEAQAYRIIVKNNWYEELCSHMDLKRNPVGYWNYETCEKAALKYKTKTDFVKNDQVAYETAIKNKWIDDICSHMIIQGNILKRCIYALEFIDNHAYIGLSYNAKKRFEDHINDVSYNTGNILKYIKKTGLYPKMKILTDYINYEEASVMEEIKKQEYIKNGWIILNKNRCGGLGGNIIKWNKEKCIEAALNCKNISELINKYGGGVYGAIRKNGWYEEIKNIIKNKHEN